MQSATQTVAIPEAKLSSCEAALWAGRILRGIVVVFLVFDGLMKVIKESHVVVASAELGYSISSIVTIGMLLLACTLLYLIPRTAFLGAILLTAYLGGAVASNVRVNHPVFECVFPVIFAVLVWAGLFLRDRRLREFILLRRA